MGSCGTISGTSKFLKEKNSQIVVTGADSAHSLLSAKTPRAYAVEGIGVDVFSEVLQRQLVDTVVPIYDEHAFQTAREYARKGYLVGPSSGAVLYALSTQLQHLKRDDVAVCILADSGRAYLSKLFSIQMSAADLEAYHEEREAERSVAL
jgi:cystathionine beta-synthase